MTIYNLTNQRHMIPPINNNINSLSPNFRKKFDAWRKEVIAKYPNAVVFETRRTQERQNFLYAQWRYKPYEKNKQVTRTLTSNHFNWNAVDIVFKNNWKLERAGPYDDLIAMWKKYWIRNLKPKETCHFEDDWTAYVPTTTPATKDEEIKKDEKSASIIWDVSAEDLSALMQLQNDKIRNWELLQLDKRMLVIVARIYKMLKQ